eukprot:scpid29495/ scgid10437/ Presequence protease, mitochondrial; Pitrilysin metalloproteinase 1
MWLRSAGHLSRLSAVSRVRCLPPRRFCNAAAQSVAESNVVSETQTKYPVGSKHHGYTVSRVENVPELSLAAVLLTHDKTGAQHLHVAREDRNNAFGVLLRTIPCDSRGVAHILEHSTLCGSQRYPCRNVFFSMLPRSLATFINAFTGSDMTLYPFATLNAKDFNNLLSVYLDCVFFPRLEEADFRQEGWRLEQESLTDVASKLQFKGIVYNEMKGAYHEQGRMFQDQIQRNVLPSNTYAHDSGGDPMDIPDLTWKQLTDFHKRHYHPSNAKFFTYGDLPLDNHLQRISDHVLTQFERIEPRTEVPSEDSWTEPMRKVVNCAPDPTATEGDKKVVTSAVAYKVLSGCTEPLENLTMSIVCHLLTSGPNSPFYQALIESGMGDAYSTGTGLDLSPRNGIFSVGLRNIAEEDTDKLESIILSVMEKVAEEGFPMEQINAVLHQLEIDQKHEEQNYGVNMLLELTMSVWNHDGDVIGSLRRGELVDQFKAALEADPEFLQKKVRQYFVENQHRVTLTMVPTAEFMGERRLSEEARLQKASEALSETDRQNLLAEGLRMENAQNEIPDVSSLPSIQLQDIDRHVKEEELSTESVDGTSVQYCLKPTNGLTYYRHLSSITAVQADAVPYLPLFCHLITRVACNNMTYQQLAQELKEHLGGLSASCYVAPHYIDDQSIEQAILFRGFCLDRKIPYLFSILSDIFSNPHFDDVAHMKDLIKMRATSIKASLTPSGHHYAMASAASSLSPHGRLSETFGGLSQMALMRQIADSEDLTEVQEHLRQLASSVLDISESRLAINVEAAQRDTVENSLLNFLSGVPRDRTDLDGHVQFGNFVGESKKRLFSSKALDVSYASHSVRTVPYSHDDHSHLAVLAHLLTDKFLHREIREKGGAYGGGSVMKNDHFTFYSYRDPSPVKSLESFTKAAEWAAEGAFSDTDIDEAKLAEFSKLDKPVLPASRGDRQFLRGISDKARQINRDRIFSVTRNDLVDVAKRYILADEVKHGIAVIGPESQQLSDSGFEVKQI